MKTGIHPEYKVARITCACGRVTETRSTVEEIHVEICSHCHPFFTGRQKLVDTAGRVERFKAKYGGKEKRKRARKAVTPTGETEASTPETETPADTEAAAPEAAQPAPEGEQAPGPAAEEGAPEPDAPAAEAPEAAAEEEETVAAES